MTVILALNSMKEFVKISTNAKIFLVATAFFVIISMAVFFAWKMAPPNVQMVSKDSPTAKMLMSVTRTPVGIISPAKI